jgi:hypothetical protein
MVEGLIVNKSFFFMFEFLKQMHVDAPIMWDGDHDKELLEWEKFQKKWGNEGYER